MRSFQNMASREISFILRQVIEHYILKAKSLIVGQRVIHRCPALSSEVLYSLAPVSKMRIFIERTFLHARADHEYNNDSQYGRIDWPPDMQFPIVQIHLVSHGDVSR